MIEPRFLITEREKKIIRLLTHPNRDIGAVLGLKEQTVKNHIQEICKVLGIPGRYGKRTKLMYYAVALGIVDIESISPGDLPVHLEHPYC